MPRYIEIKNSILKEIQDKDPGSAIESERELAVKYNASRMTVRNAVNELVAEGYLYRNKNKGTFIARSHEINSHSPYEALYNDQDVEHILIYYNVKKIPERANELLLKEDDLILRIVRQSRKNSIPISVEEICFDYQYVNAEDIKNIYKLMDLGQYAKGAQATTRFYAESASAAYALQLGVKAGDPVLVLESTLKLPNGKPILIVRSWRNDNSIIEMSS